MPKPKEGETKKQYIGRCIPIVIAEGTAKDSSQAAAICFSMWRQHQAEGKKFWVTLEEMRGLCPTCAEEMERRNFSKIDLAAVFAARAMDELKVVGIGGDFPGNMPLQMAEGLCKKVGVSGHGFMDRCKDAGLSLPAGWDLDGFCAELYNYCKGKWPSRKALDEAKAITDAPNLRAREAHFCEGCDAFALVEGDYSGICTLHEFETHRDWVCDDWSEKQPEPLDSHAVPVVIVGDVSAEAQAKSLKEWRNSEDAVVAFGGEIKSLDENGRVGGYGVLFGDEEHKDLTGTWFAADTNYGPHDGDGAQTTMNHCLPLGPELKAFAEKLLSPVKAKKDAIGIFVDTVLNLADEYEKIVYELAQAGKFKWSSGTAQRLIRAEKSGKLTNWPIIEWALTPIPAEPRLNAVTPLKALGDNNELRRERMRMERMAGTPGARPEAGGQLAADAVDTPDGAGSEVVGTIGATGTTEVATTNANHGEDEMAEIDVKAIAKQAVDDAVAAMVAALKGTPAQDNAGFVTAAPAGDKDKGVKSVNVLRYGKLDEDKETVMHEVYGGDFRDMIDRQVRAFKTYVRKGERGLDRDADAILHRQLWDVDDVTGLLKSGMTVAEIKATMVEGIDVLGGYAVPPQTSANIIQRMKGLTALRDGGALVVQTASNMLQWLKLTGGGAQYPTGMRGAWGTEIQTPSAKNFTVGLLEIPVNVYTYKVPMSVSLVEDASNLVTILEQQIADTLAIDEDTAFLTGDGANKPRGILPGGLNTDSYDHAASLSGSTLTWAGLNGLRRTVTSQYRANGRASLIGNSDTGAVIESLVDGVSRPYVEELVSGVTKVKSATWRESEAMPDATAGLVPLIYADLSAYAIVERLGLSIQRYNDSYTGINVIEFHVRKRIGGHVVEPWKIAVQVVEAS